MPRKALPVMAGLDRKVLNSRRITKRVAPSNPVFSRSFITSFDVASYSQGAEHVIFFNNVPRSFLELKKNVAHLAVYRKRCKFASQKQKNSLDNEGIFI